MAKARRRLKVIPDLWCRSSFAVPLEGRFCFDRGGYARRGRNYSTAAYILHPLGHARQAQPQAVARIGVKPQPWSVITTVMVAPVAVTWMLMLFDPLWVRAFRRPPGYWIESDRRRPGDGPR